MSRPRIGITIGDPGGIGPEVTLKALQNKDALPEADFVLFSSSSILKEEIRDLGSHLAISERISLFPVKHPEENIQKGKPSAVSGKASFLYFKTAVNQAAKNHLDALVTGPISKQSWTLAGISWAGHTEYLRSLFPHTIMSFWSERLKVALYSHHIPLKKALERIKTKDLLEFFLLLYKETRDIQTGKFRFLVAGMNPHAGEGGILGLEERKEIIPAVTLAQKEGMPISGPFPPDAVFRTALDQKETIVIALSHDQGLIPFKLVSFENGVNVTLGLPFVRTSPDHGTAFDIAGKKEADPTSMESAIRFAAEMAGQTGPDIP